MTCPEPELLAAYIDHRVSADERHVVERHLDGCAECQDFVTGATAAGSERAATARAWAWAVAGALVAAAAVVLAVRVRQNTPDPIGIPALVKAAGDQRSIEPRLSGGFAYAPFFVLRGSSPVETPPDLETAGIQIRQQLESRPTPDLLHANGDARLLLGDPNSAVASLTDATRGKRPSPALATDLAAALIVRGTRDDRSADFAQALDVIEGIPPEAITLEALFNKALALEGLKRDDGARDVWREYLNRDGASGWADEARRHVADLSR